MLKKIFVALLFLPLSLFAQVLTPTITAYLDSALHRIRMTRSDMFMRWDVWPDDPYRLPVVKKMFGDPMSTIPYADSLAHALPASFDSPRDFVGTFATPLNITLPQFELLPRRLTKQELLAKYNVNIDVISPHLRAAVVELLSGISAADTLVKQARAVYTPEEFKFLVDNADTLVRESKTDDKASLVELKEGEMRQDSIARRIYAIANRYPRELIFEATAIILQSINVAKAHIREMSQTQKDTLHTMTFISSLGRIAIGGAGADMYDGDYICILDLGGNDIYRRPNSNKISALNTPVSVILDMAGDDYYEGGECSFASGYFGVGVLDDVSGDDIYNGGSFSLGAGFFGAGILLDESGDDKYIGGTFVEGAGAFGMGALIDKQGNDTYLAQLYAQGFGFTSGFGAVVDESGNDTYTVAAEYTDILRYDDHFVTLSQGCGLGYNAIASGGIGIISERGGNDTYSADIFGQGCGYWYSFGAIVDDGGNDRYNAFQYAQGAGIHRAFGVLIDKKGSDYYSSHGVSQGCGHDVGFGALLDVQGDDFYSTESLSLGAGNANAISFFCDASGNDAYIGKSLGTTFGYSDDRSGYGMIGIFLDLGGKDEYPTYNERNNTIWTQSFYGVGIDA
ncbi:MAG TPA: hypothetical protein VFJ29_01650, partial [Candidatus Kapabacteria bacterium]|nr:hypothetical protein [Candidatus Kapabacteria bacterium]